MRLLRLVGLSGSKAFLNAKSTSRFAFNYLYVRFCALLNINFFLNVVKRSAKNILTARGDPGSTPGKTNGALGFLFVR